MNIEHNTDVFFIEFERKLFLKQKTFALKKKCDTIKERQGGKTPEEIADMTGKNLEEILKIQQKDLQVEDENKN